MHARALRRAAVVAAAVVLLAVPGAFADRVTASGDGLVPIGIGTYDAGTVGPGGSTTVAVSFRLACRNGSHVDPGQTVHLALDGGVIPPGGAITGDGTTIGPLPGEWPVDGVSCFGSPTLDSATPASVTLRGPLDPGTYDYVVAFATSLLPPGAADDLAIPVAPSVVLRLTVLPDLPPALVLPDDLVVEGDTLGGATVAFDATATDGEDDPDPLPNCSPASGDLFALGTTAVACTVTDSARQSATGAFHVTVVDTTAPVFAGVPDAVEVETGSTAGGPAAYTPPTANDVVAGSVPVVCLPGVGDAVPLGTTIVTCSTSDPSGNDATASFPLTMTYRSPVVLAVVFDAPIGPTGVVGGSAGRTVPVKATLLRDGEVVVVGAVDLVLAACAGGPPIGSPVALSRQGDRWVVGLDTEGLAGCVRATVRLDGHPAGTYDIGLGSQALGKARR